MPEVEPKPEEDNQTSDPEPPPVIIAVLPNDEFIPIPPDEGPAEPMEAVESTTPKTD